MNWGKIKHFSAKEFGIHADKMDETFLLLLDEYREIIGKPFQVLAGYATDGHAPKSYHYLGRAIDFRIVDPITREPLSMKDHFLIAMASPFNGIGLYSWSHSPFLHLDDRESIQRKIWICESEGSYRNLDSEWMRKFLS